MRMRSYKMQLCYNIIIAWLLPTLVVSISYYHYASKVLQEQQFRHHETAVRSASLSLEKELRNDRIQVLYWMQTSNIFKSFANDNADAMSLSAKLQTELKDFIHINSAVDDFWLYFYPQDFFLTSEGSFDYDFYFTRLTSCDYRHALEGKSVFEPVQIRISDNNSARQLLGVNTSLFSESGVPVGFFSLLIDPDFYFDECARHGTADGAILAVLDESGNCLMSNVQDPEQLLSQIDLSQRNTILTLNDSRYLQSILRSEDSGWRYVVLSPYDQIYRSLAGLRGLTLFLCLSTSCIGVVISYALSKRLYRPLHCLVQHIGSEDVIVHNEFDLISRKITGLLAENDGLQDQFLQFLSLTQQSILSRLLEGELHEHGSLTILSKYQLAFPQKLFSIMIVKAKKTDVMMQSIVDLVKEIFLYTYVIDKDGSKILIVNHDTPPDRSMFDSFQHLPVCICVSDPVLSVQEIHFAYDQAASQLQYASLRETFEYLTSSDVRDHVLQNSYLDMDQFETHVINLIEQGNYDAARELYDQASEKFFSPDEPLLLLISRGARLDEFMLRCCGKYGIGAEAYLPLASQRDPQIIQEQIAIRKKRFLTFLEMVHKRTQDEQEHLAGLIRTHIDSHLNEDLSIDRITQQFGISYSTLLRFMKERFGMTYLEYLTSRRMLRAKLLLTQTNSSIDEISRQIGYLTSASFIRNFNKYEGISPGQYRKMNK